MKPLDNILIIDFSQFLSAPSCTLRLADLGAKVIKIEKPETGDICRQMYVSDLVIDGQSTLFHAINRNKDSFVADLKNAEEIKIVKQLLALADIVVHNFRPGVMDRLGLSYEIVKAINPKIIYADISGYGDEGEWKDEPGQDLLVQGVSGLTWLSGAENDGPVPMGVSVTDILAGTYLTQGILAALYNRTNTGKGSHVQVNMLASSLEFQFEAYTTFLNDGNLLPQRSNQNPSHAYLSAPYGIYQTSDGYLALAMGNINFLGQLLSCQRLIDDFIQEESFSKRDEIKLVLANHLINNTTNYWLNILEPADIWCAEVLDYETFTNSEGYRAVAMEQTVELASGKKLKTTRCPIKINGEVFTSNVGAPPLGAGNKRIIQHYNLMHEDNH